MNHGNGVSLLQFLFMSVAQLSLMIVFYTNYLWLTPKYYGTGDKKMYWIINIVMVVSMGIGLHYWMEFTRMLFDKPYHGHRGAPYIYVFFMLRNIFNLALSAAVATMMQLAARWKSSENARHEAESARTDAELKNLRSQINPHFLLNTLNNIYALTAFDSKRAQDAIQELSKLLRHVLYDNEQQYVNLEKEVQFLTNYVNLMKIRLSGNVDVQLNINIPKPCNILISPLLFISLIENAFKHGVSSTLPSYIHINVEATNDMITCDIENTNFPKSDKDNSGHGIGLKQVASRLELLYPCKYEWFKGTNTDNTIYSSKITIHDTKLCNN